MGDGETQDRRALVVDDDPGVLRAVERVLRGNGWHVESATESGAAVALLQAPGARFDIAVLDVALGFNQSGLTLAADLHRLDPRLHFLFISGHVDLDVSAARVPRDRITFLGKPLSVTLLVEETERLYRRSLADG